MTTTFDRCGVLDGVLMHFVVYTISTTRPRWRRTRWDQVDSVVARWRLRGGDIRGNEWKFPVGQ